MPGPGSARSRRALMLAALMLAAVSRGPLPWIAVPVPVVGVTALTALGVRLNRRGRHERASVAPVEQKLADVTSVAEVVQRALLPLGDCSAAGRTLRFPPSGALLFYTDGVTEARNPRHRCYPLPARLSALAQASTNGLRPDLLDRLRDDLLRHVGARLDDDAALVLVRAPDAWGDPAPQPAQATAS